MSTTIQIKRSSTASAIPVTGDIAVGELAVNLADKRLFTKQSDGTIIELSTNPTDLDAATLRIDGVEITASATELNKLDGFTGSTTELNILDGVTATTAEINKLDGFTGSTAELNFVDGVTSNIQTQLNSKANLSGANFTGDVDVTGSFTVDGTDESVGITAGEFGVIGSNTTDGTGSSPVNLLSTFLDTGGEYHVQLHHHGSPKLATTSTGIDVTGDVSTDTLTIDGTTVTATATELNYTDGVTSNIQTQLDAMVEKSGDTMTGDLSLGDNVKAKFGAGNDLQIYHDGSDSIIVDNGTGDLLLRGSNSIRLQSHTGETYFKGDLDGASKIYHNNAEKLATTSTGVDVTGTITSDGLTVDGTGTAITLQGNNGAGTLNTLQFRDTDTATATGQDIGRLEFYSDDASSAGVQAYIAGQAAGGSGIGRLIFGTGSGGSAVDRMLIDSNGDVQFYEDTGTTAKMVWDASAESLGIGTASPSEKIDFGGTGWLKVGRGTARAGGVIFPHTTISSSSRNWGIRNDVSSYGDFAILQSTTQDGDLTVSGNEEVRFTINNAGNVGIGTASPERPLHIASATPYIVFEETDASQKFSLGSGGGKFFLYDETDSAQRLTVDSAGNVGIGTASPSAKLSVDGNIWQGNTAGVQIGGITNAAGWYDFGGTSNVNGAQISGVNIVRFRTGSTERARIDSSGNLLVGKTTTNFNTDGFQAFSGGFVHATATQGTANSGTVITVNRKSTDGSIVDLKKDGSTVGSIGVESGNNLYIDCDAANHAGLLFWSGASASEGRITPRFNGSGADGNVDLGRSNNRFKDLYLSGGVYLGGTGAANKLDDYEEGIWTPTVFGSSTAGSYTYGNGFGVYTKIGRQVTVSCVLTNVTETSAGNGYLKIGNLPFTKASSTQAHGAGRLEQISFGSGNTSFVVSFISGSATNVIYFRGLESSGNGEDILITDVINGTTDIEFTITYIV